MTPPVKNPQDYNQALLDMATQSLAELARTAEQKAGKRTPAQESHFLCTWMADSLKEKRFSRLVMEDLKAWVQLGRTLGAGADLKGLLSRIVCQYGRAMACSIARAIPSCGMPRSRNAVRAPTRRARLNRACGALPPRQTSIAGITSPIAGAL